MKKSDNKVINLFEQSSIGTKALVITESLKIYYYNLKKNVF